MTTLTPYRPTAAGQPLPRGFASIDRSGWLRVNIEDARANGIEKLATVVLDRVNHRVGVRRNHAGEFAMTANTMGSKKVKTVCFKVRGALRELGCDLDRAAGRYEIIADGEALLIAPPRVRQLKPTTIGHEEGGGRVRAAAG